MTHQTFGAGWLAALLLGAGAAQADTITLDFDQKEHDVLGDNFCFEEEGFAYCDDNQGLYGFAAPYFTLSDYDWDPFMRVESLDGRLFDPQQVDLTAINDQLMVECTVCEENQAYNDGAPAENRYPTDVEEYVWFPNDFDPSDYVISPYDFDFIRVEGFRDGISVALHSFGALSDFDGVYGFSPEFSGIDALEIELMGSRLYSPIRVGPQTLVTCENPDLGCFDGRVDNLVVAFSAAPAAVPLPASGMMALVAFGALGWMRRRPA